MTASNYAEFGKLGQDFKEEDFQLLLFPCNQFLRQEPQQPTPKLAKRMSKGSLDMDMAKHVMLMSMVDVNGANASPVFEFLKYNSNLYNEATNKVKPIPWNFTKFLINPKGGSVYKCYTPGAKPEEIRSDISTLLSDQSPSSVARKCTTSLANS